VYFSVVVVVKISF